MEEKYAFDEQDRMVLINKETIKEEEDKLNKGKELKCLE